MEPGYLPESTPALARRQELSVDQALTQIGEFGAGQRLQLSIAGLGLIICSFQALLVVLSGLNPVDAGNIVCLKGNQECLDALAKPGRPNVCSLPPGSWEWADRGDSLLSDFDLVCGLEWLVQLANAAFFGGCLLGCAVFQLASERLGRRRLMYTGAAFSGITGIMCCTAPSLWLYMLFRSLTGVAVGTLGAAAFALATDPVGPSWRPMAGLMLQAFFSGGACLATLAAWVVPGGWRGLSLLAALASLAYIATWSYVHESPRWLLLRGRKGEATAALAAFAFANRSRPPELPLADPVALLSNPQSRFQDLLAHPRLRQRLLLSGGCWLAAGLAYWGGLLLAEALGGWEASGEGSVLVTLLTGFSYEVPGVAAAGLAAERVGRRYTLAAAFLQAGGSLLASALTRASARRALAVAARFGLAGAAATLVLQAGELYPAAVRSQGQAASGVCGWLGTLLAPGLAALGGAVGVRVPLLVAGAACLAAGPLGVLLPETLGAPAPETIQEMGGGGLGTRRLKSWSVALRQMFRTRSRQLLRGTEEDVVTVLRTA